MHASKSFCQMFSKKECSVTVTYSSSAFTGDFWTGGIVVHAPGYAWLAFTCDVSGSRVGSGDIVCQRKGGIDNFSWKNGAPFTPQARNICWLFGKLQALDARGEWFLDSATQTLYLWLEDSSDPPTKLIEAKTRQLAFDLKSKLSSLSMVYQSSVPRIVAEIESNINYELKKGISSRWRKKPSISILSTSE